MLWPSGILCLSTRPGCILDRRANTYEGLMAPSTASPANAAAPSASDIERAAAFACEPFLLDGEGPEAPLPARRHLDAALVEIDAYKLVKL
jgi:hypothetical protein